jgi:hypothetical protein
MPRSSFSNNDNAEEEKDILLASLDQQADSLEVRVFPLSLSKNYRDMGEEDIMENLFMSPELIYQLISKSVYALPKQNIYSTALMAVELAFGTQILSLE